MRYRRLGKTDLEVSVVGIGTWQLGGEWGKEYTQAEADEVFDAGREAGINLIDTAECYGDHTSERLVGGAIQSDREKWIVATKFGHGFTGFLKRDQLWSAGDVRKQLEDSLKALKTDYIDLYQFHSGNNEAFDNDELWKMLEEQVKAGKVRHIGISATNSDLSAGEYQVEHAAEAGAEAIQIYYNRLSRNPEAKMLPECRKQDLGVLARVPMASGFLSGKYKPGAQFSSSDVRSTRDKEWVNKNLKEVERIQKEEIPEGMPMAGWALAWCLKHPAVTCVIPGCRTADQVRKNAAAADIEL